MKRYITCLGLLCSLSFYITAQDQTLWTEKQKDIYEIFEILKPGFEYRVRQSAFREYRDQGFLGASYAESMIKEYDNWVAALMPTIDLHISPEQIKQIKRRLKAGKPLILGNLRYNLPLLSIQLIKKTMIWVLEATQRIAQVNEVGFAYYDKEYAKALKLAEGRLAKNPSDALTLLYKGLVLRDSLNQNAQFLKLTKKAIKLKPDFHQAYYWLSDHYLRNKQFELAHTNIDSALVYSQDYAAFVWQKARIFYYDDKYKAAEDLLDNLIERNDQYEHAYSLRAQIHAIHRRYDLGLIDVEQAIRLDSTNGAFYEIRGGIYNRMGKYQLALNDFNKMIVRGVRKASAYHGRGWVYQRQQQYKQALRDFNQAIRLDSTNALYYRAKSWPYYKTEQYELALKYLNKAIALDNTEGLFFEDRGWVYKSFGKAQLGIQDFDKALKLDPAKGNTYEGRARCYASMGEYQKAARDFEQALALDSTDTFCYEGQAFNFINMGQYELALKGFQKVLSMNPPEKNRIFTYNNIGHTYYKMGQYQKALKNINHSLKYNPKNSYAYKNRALVYIAQNKLDLACKDLRRAQQLGYKKLYGNEVAELLKKYCDE